MSQVMNKTKRYFNLLPLLLAVIFVSSASADGGTVLTLSGEVKASPCTVDATTKPVTLGTYYISTMKEKGDYVKFSVTLSSCPTGTSSVTATFSGNADASLPGSYYANTTAQGAATGIHIELATDDTTPAGLGNGKTLKASVDSNKKVEFKLQARVNKGDATPTSGVIQTTVNITYEYA
ncbi:type 1 fimbrial protein [Enterobacter hormaechei]|uniref:fimbrial protein n=1 Tax=unclassified Enterobacter cloacae complex TaxID=2757714 RepID=UPI001872E9EE|nr:MULTISPECIES: fimbrial protein [unclassified Enterobacter cloacae complex]ELC6559916.1 type 1 fimbrial protein [Enterobacter hormaechei]MBE4815370.1 type 1 fimbrial protein [Enterobacter cloacae complex sp. P41C]MBE4851996.1 type 1 fimbrial protein [Enterobacter cloacae complex sp. P41RS]